jgi:pimeloyl-ACP methyl ester carboxylesterase
MEMVEVNGYHLAADLSGEAGPTVAFVSGFGETRSAWRMVLPLLAESARLVTYDRAGIGDSGGRADHSAHPYSDLADELGHLLKVLGVPEPYILVGHSFGCLVIRAFAVRQPERVAGMVLVESSVRQLVLWPGQTRDRDGDRPDATRVDLEAGAAELTPITLRVPAVVLTRTHGKGVWEGAPDPAAVEAHWQRAQAELATEVGAPQVIARDAGHRLNEEAPALLALAVDSVVHAAVTGQPLLLDPIRVGAAGGRIVA